MQQYINWQICIFFFHQEKLIYVHKYMKCTRTEHWHKTQPGTGNQELQGRSCSPGAELFTGGRSCCQVNPGTDRIRTSLTGTAGSLHIHHRRIFLPQPATVQVLLTVNEKHPWKRFKLKGFTTEQWFPSTQVTHVAFCFKVQNLLLAHIYITP